MEVSCFQGAHTYGYMHYLDPSTMRKAGFGEQIMSSKNIHVPLRNNWSDKSGYEHNL